MSELRRHLDQARAAHRAARYPGDLAADVLQRAAHTTATITPGSEPRATTRMRFGWRVRLGAGVAAAVAASIAVGIFLNKPPVSSHLPDIEPVEAIAHFAMPATPGMPADVPWAAPGQDLGAAPGMPGDLPWMGGSMAEIRGSVF